MEGKTLGELAEEVERQPTTLEKFTRTALPRATSRSIFVGAGDSYAVALAAFYGSRGRSIALDPYVLASAPEFADGADVYFVSVSGRTSSNVLAARKVKHHAKRTTAITAIADSPLARITDRVVGLPMDYAPRTPGMLSFSLSLLAILRIVGIGGPCDYSYALKEARKVRLRFCEGRGTTYFLGNSMAYPVALYAAAKAYEVLGARTHAELLEQFSHLELFSLGDLDAVNSFACFDPSGVARKLDRALASRGFESQLVPTWGGSIMERLFHAVFSVQLSVLRKGEASGLTSPMFLSARRALDTSDEMIY